MLLSTFVKIIPWFAFIVTCAGLIWKDVAINNQYDVTIGSYWDLSVKASTLDKKAEYLDKYVAALKGASLSDHGALFYKNPNNSVEQNFIALESLQTRLHEIKGMSVSSFEYQQAINQITQQEQNEAGAMNEVFNEAWFINNHLFFTSTIGGFVATLMGVLLIILVIISLVWESY